MRFAVCDRGGSSCSVLPLANSFSHYECIRRSWIITKNTTCHRIYWVSLSVTNIFLLLSRTTYIMGLFIIFIIYLCTFKSFCLHSHRRSCVRFSFPHCFCDPDLINGCVNSTNHRNIIVRNSDLGQCVISV